MRTHAIVVALLSGVLAGAAVAQTGNVVKYHATMKDVKYVYSVSEPVARLKTAWTPSATSSRHRAIH
jgi:hypothetical protein